MRIANVLERGRQQFGSSPCAAHVSHEAVRVLTYDGAWLALNEHQQWLAQTIPKNGQEVVLAYLSSNSTDMMISLLASSSTSVSVALLNTRWTSSEMAAALQTGAPVIVLYSADFRTKALETQAKLIQQSQEAVAVELPLISLAYLTSNWSDITRRPVSRTNESIDSEIQQVVASSSRQEDALIVFTSGTTSGSKGVRLSHGALWIQALAKLRYPCRYSQTTRMLSSTVPLFHVGGLSSLLALWLAGGTWMVVTNTGGSSSSSFDPPTVFQAVSHPTFATNTLVVVPAMLHALLLRRENRRNQAIYPRVELLLIGGQSASPSMLVRLQQVFPNALIVQTYACTEAASSMTFFEPTVDTELPPLPDGLMGDCVGRPPPHVELVLVQQNNGRKITTPYKVGVLATRGPHVMGGYWKHHKDESTRNGWFITHDLAFQDVDGRYYMCGRAKDVIRSGGETVIALEVERVLLQHARIVECAVFALPDERFGEAVCAAIVSSRSLLSLQEVRQHCAGLLAGYKRPRRLFHVPALPRNSSGKVVKHELVKQFKMPQSKL